MNILNQISLKLRLTILFVLIFAGSLAVFSVLIYNERKENKILEFDASLYNYAIDIAESLDIDSYGEVEFDPSIIRLSEKVFPFALGKSFISVVDINGKVVAHSQNVSESVPDLIDDATVEKVLKKGVSYHYLNSPDHGKLRVINYLLPVLKIDSPLILHISVPTINIDRSQAKLKKFLILSLAVITILSFGAGYFFVDKALLPIVEITKKANSIEIKNLNERVPEPKSHDEIYYLAHTINSLFERLQKSFDSQERFIQDASHQLKTPLAIMKGELDLFKTGVRQKEELDQFILNMSDELNTLIKLTNDLLILARVDSGEKNLSLAPISVVDILLSQASRLSKLSVQKEISINLDLESINHCSEAELMIMADSDLIGILFYNFIENAIKYSAKNSVVAIKCEYTNGEIFVAVKDQGRGIKVGQERLIFDRFYRSEENKNESGSGLGLAICKAVADLHKAEIWAVNNTDIGSTFYFKMRSLKGSV